MAWLGYQWRWCFWRLPRKPPQKPPDKSADVNAIRATIESYVAAYNRGDAKAVAAHWSDSGEWISPSGERFQGKQAIEKELRTLFAENKGVRIEVLRPVHSPRSPDVAIEEGTVRVVRPDEPPSDSTYLAIHVKKDGQWKLDTVRETEVPETAPATSPLQDLAWLAGEWTDASPDATGRNQRQLDEEQDFSELFVQSLSAGHGRSRRHAGHRLGSGGGHDSLLDVRFRRRVRRRHLVEEGQFLGRQVQPGPARRPQGVGHQYLHNRWMTTRSPGSPSAGKWTASFLPNVEEVKMVRKTAADVK